jgi:hypothetical protein
MYARRHGEGLADDGREAKESEDFTSTMLITSKEQ